MTPARDTLELLRHEWGETQMRPIRSKLQMKRKGQMKEGGEEERKSESQTRREEQRTRQEQKLITFI